MENTIDFTKALTHQTAQVFEDVSRLECIKGLYLCGGTAQALMLGHRQSEDLDFELLGVSVNRPPLNSSEILQEVMSVFPGATYSPLGDDHFDVFLDNGVKLTFFRPKYNVPTLTPKHLYNNITVPSLQELLGMKLYVLTQRIKFRDYYDINSLLSVGCNLHDGVKYACDFSKHSIHSKDIINRLLSPKLYTMIDREAALKYALPISSSEIHDKIKQVMIAESKNVVNKDKILNNFHRIALSEKDLSLIHI